VVDFAAVARAFLDDAIEREARLSTGFAVSGFGARPGGRVDVYAADGRALTADRVVLAQGLHADRLAGLAGASPEPSIVPLRGKYHRLHPVARHLVRGLICPVRDPRSPFLGVHLTRRVDGEVLLGPNAVLATAREGYTKRDVDPREIRDLLS